MSNTVHGRKWGFSRCPKAWCVYLSVITGCLATPAVALERHGIPADALAVWVGFVDRDRPALTYRAKIPVNPASTMKLLTSWVALTRLHPAFSWETNLISSAPIENGVLQGDLYWVGQGDPRFYSTQLTSLLNILQQRGIGRLAGQLFLDGSAYSRLSTAEGFDADDGQAFMAAPDPLLTNLNVVTLRFFNDEEGARVVLDPPVEGIALSSSLSVASGEICGDVRNHVQLGWNEGKIIVNGKLPSACDGATMFFYVPMSAEQFAAAALIGQWHQLGGKGPLGVATGQLPGHGSVLSFITSEPLFRILYDMNKFSNNAMARSLYLTVGRVTPQSGDTLVDAERAVRRTLAQSGINTTGLILENGSGLSRNERMTATMLGEVLRAAARGPYAAELIASLPIAGYDGSLKRRLGDVGARLRLKTGTLNDVAALAGFWQSPTGRQLVIVAIVNAPRAARYKPALDQVVRDVLRRVGK